MTYQEEQNILLNNLLEDYYKDFRPSLEEKDEFPKELEIYISRKCNQRCEYCYLVDNENLYPQEIDNEPLILKNLIYLLNFYSEQNFSFKTVHFFSGEILGTTFSFKIFDILLWYIKKEKIKINTILIPTNMSFIVNQTATNKIDEYCKKFHEYGTFLCLSASNDGIIIDKEVRPFKNRDLNNKLKSEDYYKKIIDFCADHNFCYHPMVSIYELDKWPENYKWWYEQIEKYPQVYQNMYQAAMFLEVRNNFWDTKSILQYLKFLNFMIDYDIERYWKQQDNWTPLYSIMSTKRYKNFEVERVNMRDHCLLNYIPYDILHHSTHPECGVTNTLSIRLGDLAIVPCHRTSYEKFIFGYYQIEKNKIIGVKANNVNLAFRIIRQTHRSSPKCDSCSLYGRCLYGCYGAQYEATDDILYPCDSVCHLERAKTIFVLLKSKWLLDKYGDKIKEEELMRQDVDKIIDDLINEEREEGALWKKIFYTLNY